MNLYEFKNRYFADWRIAGVTNYGTERGYIKLRNKGTAIKIFFKFNGAKHWTDNNVTIYHIVGCDMFEF